MFCVQRLWACAVLMGTLAASLPVHQGYSLAAVQSCAAFTSQTLRLSPITVAARHGLVQLAPCLVNNHTVSINGKWPECRDVMLS